MLTRGFNSSTVTLEDVNRIAIENIFDSDCTTTLDDYRRKH